MSKETIGTLIIVVLKARHLRDKHSFYKQDPYASISLNGVTRRTKADIKGGQHPVWDEELRFPVYSDSSDLHRLLKVECWSKEPKADDMVGQGNINIEETLTTGEFDDWIQMYEPSGQARGEVYLEMTFYATGPPPVRRPSKLLPHDRLSRPHQHQPSNPPMHPIAERPQPHSTSLSRPPSQLQPHHPPASSFVKTHSPSTSQSYSTNGLHLAPPHSPPSSRSPSRSPPKDLPPLPDHLRPTAHPPVKDVPSILRPGGPPVHHSPGMRSDSPSPPVPPENPINARYPSPSHGSGLAASVSASAYPPAPEPFYTPSQAAPTPFSFPSLQAVPPAAPTYVSPYNPPVEPELPDPYLEVRYQTPLPLPDEPHSQPQSRPSILPGASAIRDLATPREPELPAWEGPSEAERIAKELAREEEERRRRQEEDDEALAKALDRELNASPADGGEVRGRTGMPGAW